MLSHWQNNVSGIVSTLYKGSFLLCTLHYATNSPLCRDGRLKAGDCLLMIDNNIVVGLDDGEAEAVLQSAQRVVQLVVAKGVRQAGLKRALQYG